MNEATRSGDGALPLSMARRVDEICYRFEVAWKAGQRPRIEDYLGDTVEPEHSALLRELIALDIAYRQRAGEQPRPEEYRHLYGSSPAASNQQTSGSQADTPLAARGTRLRCPHCHNPIQLADDQPDEVLCPGCGGSFRVREARQTTTASGSRQLGKFQPLERVGLGAFGAVWRARDTELDRIVALKIPHASLLTSQDDLERFHREARAAAQLRHPGIVTVHEVVTLEGLPTIVSDFIMGVPLKDFLEVRRLTFREAASLVADVAEALDYAHSMGLVHRDIKPANIMIEASPPLTPDPSPPRGEGSGDSSPLSPGERGAGTSSPLSPWGRGVGGEGLGLGRPLVMDFGLALRQEAEITLTLDGHIIGTPAYMSPEQAAGKGHKADRRSDVYSLGVILYEMLTGELPFRGSKMMLLYQVLQEEPRPPRRINDKIPRDLETICLKAMAKSPARRYATARELADDLRRFLKGEPIQARPIGALERSAKWVKRRPAVAALLATVVLILIAGTAVSLAFAFDAAQQAKQARDNETKAKQNAEAARKNEVEAAAAKADLQKANDKLEGMLARSLLVQLGLQGGQLLTDPEIDALWELAVNRGERVGYQFVAEALRNPVTIRLLKNRAEPALHAAVGLEPARRAQVEQLLVERLQDPKVDDGKQTDLALVAAALGELTPAVRTPVAQTLTRAMAETTDPIALSELARGLAAVAARLEPAEAARFCAPATATLSQAMNKTNNPAALRELARGLQAVVARLRPAEAATLARAMAEATNPVGQSELVRGLQAMVARLGPAEAAQAAATLTQAMVSMNDPAALHRLAEGLSAVAARLEPAEAARLCAQAAAILTHVMARVMGRTNGPGALSELARVLAAVAARLAPAEAGQAASTLTLAMAKTNDPYAPGELARVLAAVAARLRPAQAAATLTQAMAETNDPSTLYQLAEGLSAVAARLGPAEAARLCAPAAATLTRAMAETNDLAALGALVHGLLAVAAQLEPAEAARLCAPAAATLSQAMAKRTNYTALGELARGLSAVAARLEPAEATRLCAPAATTLSQAMAKALNPAPLRELARGLAAVAARLGPAEAGATLAQAMAKTTDPYALRELARGLLAVAARLEPAEATRLCAPAAATLLQAMAKATKRGDPSALASGLSAVAARLGPAEATATLTQAMAKTNDPYALSALAQSLSAVLTLADPPDLSRRCAAVAAAIGHLASTSRPIATAALLGPSLEPLPCRFSTQQLVDLLKQPLCVGPARRVVLDQLEKRYRQKFADHWAFVRFAQEQNLGLDFTTPPKRPAN